MIRQQPACIETIVRGPLPWQLLFIIPGTNGTLPKEGYSAAGVDVELSDGNVISSPVVLSDLGGNINWLVDAMSNPWP